MFNRNKNKYVLLSVILIISSFLFTSCAPPEIKGIPEGYGDATIPAAVKANRIAQEQIDQYKAKYGPKEDYQLVVEKNVGIPMRDGTELKADIFRPAKEGRYPVIMSMTAYMKDRPWFVPSNHEGNPGPYQVWETPNPEDWVPWGYVLIRIDTRGFGQSRSDTFAFLNDQEANDYYDSIEWAAHQPWSNGNVGLSGISYMAINQWYAAAKQPPSLKAIIPWEGMADQYRDSVYRGGILSFAFIHTYVSLLMCDYSQDVWPHNQPPGTLSCAMGDLLNNYMNTDYWNDRRVNWDNVKVPLLSAGNWVGWSGAGHIRGNTEGFKLAASPHKKLRMHTGCHQDSYYSKEGFLEQLRFFDYWLKGIDNGVMDEPPVKLAIRNSTDRFDFKWRYENEWPIARTQYKKMYLDAATTSLKWDLPKDESSITYEAPGGYTEGDNRVMFVSEPFKKDTEITGEIKANLWCSSSIDDMNIHTTLMIIQPTLHPLLHKWFGTREIVTTGWLSAKRSGDLDPVLSTESRPYYLHNKLTPLTPGEPREIQIEILPTSMVYRKGSRLVLIVSSNHPMTDQTAAGKYRVPHAQNTILTGGRYDSYLQIPVIPPQQ